MSSQKLDVEVFDGDQLVEVLPQRPVRLLPDRQAGIVYGGEVYPLYMGDRINLRDTPAEKSLCNGFVRPGSPIPYSIKRSDAKASDWQGLRLDRWYVESNRFGHYLVFDGSLSVAQKAVALMEKSGLGVRRWDESIRESDNGELYDWFIRLEYDGTREECIERITKALSPESVSDSATTQGARSLEVRQLYVQLAVLQAENSVLKLRTAGAESTAAERERLTSALANSEQLVASLERNLKEIRAKAQTERKELRHRLSDQEQELDRLRLERTSDGEAQQRIRQLTAAKKDVEEAWIAASDEAEIWEVEAKSWESRVQVLESDLQRERAMTSEVQEQLERATIELAETRDTQRERRTALRLTAGPPRGSLDEFLQRFLPRTDFDGDLVETLLSWPNPAPAVDFLRQIDRHDKPRGLKSIQGKPGWYEVPKVNTGRRGKEDAGRIYYAPTGEGRVLVVLHEKQDDREQKRVIAQLPDDL